MLSRPLRTAALPLSLVVAAGLVLSGCGRKGDLDPPSTPQDQLNKRSANTDRPVPERRFILDPLL